MVNISSVDMSALEGRIFFISFSALGKPSISIFLLLQFNSVIS